jgi:hypothetical protein
MLVTWHLVGAVQLKALGTDIWKLEPTLENYLMEENLR